MRNRTQDYLGTEYIVRRISDITGIKLAFVRQVWRAVPEVLTEALVNGIPVRIPSVCTITPYLRGSRNMTYCLDKEIKGGLGIRKRTSEGGHHVSLRMPPINSTIYSESQALKLALNPDIYFKKDGRQIKMKPEVLQSMIDEALERNEVNGDSSTEANL